MDTPTLLLGILSLIAFIWVVYEVWGKGYGLSTGAKVLWSLAAFFFSVITAIVFYFVVKRKVVA